MDDFRQRVNKEYQLSLSSYDELWQWSVDHYDTFWEEFFHFSNVKYSVPYDEVVDTTKGITDIPEWFHGSRLNYAENLLSHKNDKKVALITYGEGQEPAYVTFAELRRRVATMAAALRRAGVVEGDRVVGYLPNSLLAVEAMLATASIGAVWSSTSPDFGVTGVLDRFSQIRPKLILSVEAVCYNGRTHDHLDKLSQVVAGLPDLERVVLFPFCGTTDIDTSRIPNCVMYEDFISGCEGSELKFEQLPFNHPLFIMFSSGTTGTPKCMVHSAGGTLIQHLKEHFLHGNMSSNDVILYYTTVGWMMWNWLVSALAVGATVVLYDGSPFVPSPHVLWECVDRFGITILGTGARWLAALEERGVCPSEGHSLSSLHTILSTGSPLKPQSYDYVYSKIKKDVLLGSISGGTDIVSCFAGQNPTVPVYRGELQSRNLGMAVQCWSEDGKPQLDESGELVCTKPFPCMPTHFWNDEDGIKYSKAYFSKFQGVWAHSDFCTISSTTGGLVMLGRSDGTLNPSGVRFGSAEIYNIVEHVEGVVDSLCVAQSYRSDERVILFLKMETGHNFSPELVKRVKTLIRVKLSARHVPAIILETTDIPYTINGKKVEVAVKRIISGDNVLQRGALANPKSLDLYYNLPQLVDTHT